MKFFTFAALALGLRSATASVIRLDDVAENALRPRQDSTNCENTATSRSCWGEYDVNTNYYTTFPDTGVTREYWLSIDRIDCAPDGVSRTCLAFNGTVPGPTLMADWGDRLKIHVTNNLVDNGTAIHWHGLRQLNSAEYDGVPGVTQCPIAPGNTLTYDFRVTQYGSTWYHSHLSLQYAEGLYGGMILNGPASADYDEDLGTLFLSDWSHTEAFALWDSVKTSGPPTMENGLINGTNTYGDGGAKYETVFESGKKYRFRLVNAATHGHFQFSVDGHSLTVIGNDLVPLVPYTTDAISIADGQRYDVIVEANAEAGDYWLRAQWVDACSTNGNPDGITGIVRYDASSTAEPTTNSSVTTERTCNDEPVASLVPQLALNVGDLTTNVYEEVNFATGGPWFQWTINGSSLELDWENPTLLQMIEGNTTFPLDYNVVSIDKTKTDGTPEWAVLIIQDNTGFGIFHPIHLHGHDFWILEQKTGVYSDASGFNFVNPPRRDVASLPGNGYLAIAFELDNPGAWLVHCHIAWHASQGFALEFVESQSSYDMGTSDQAVFENQCSSWESYMGTSTYTQYSQHDSGV